ncbi:hypothetical protein J4408_03820 [Candidatus Pacearchaeota archaeon]|nr:hypothetical protein [Candidatus Pacearchaeota archaeon]
MEIVQEALKEFGLAEKEVNIYLSNLKIGSNTANEISRKSGLQRELTYTILNRLEKKGLINHSIKNGIKFFDAVNPENLLKKIEEKENLLKKALPHLNLLKKEKSVLKPKTETFEGKEGIKSLFNNIIRFYEQNKEIKILEGFGSAGKLEQVLKWALPHFIERRVKAGVKFRGIYNETKEGMEKKNLPLSEIRFLPEEFESPSFYLIYKNHIVIVIFSEEPVGIFIESKEVYESYKIYFKILWKIAKP